MTRYLFLVALLLSGVPLHADVSLKPDSFSGGINFKYPQPLNAAQKPAGKLTQAAIEGNTAQLKYDNGSAATATVSGGKITIAFTKVAAGVKHFQMESHLGFGVVGSEFQVDGKDPIAFPEAKPDKPHLFQGNTKEFTLLHAAGNSTTVKFPGSVYTQVTDTREWGWTNFIVKATLPVTSGTPSYTFTYSGEKASADAPKKVMVDKFGQYALKDWPLKVKSEVELMADVEEEKAYYASFNPPAVDKYGGLPGSKEKFDLQATGFFHVEKKGERWYLVNPDGNWFFYKGVCAIAPYLNNVVVKGKSNLYEWLPPFESEYKSAYGQNSTGTDDGKFTFYTANWMRKHGGIPFDNKLFTREAYVRIQAFGFNAGGAFGTGDRDTRRELNVPYVMEMPLRSYQGVKHLAGLREIWDPFDPAIRAAVEKNLAGLAKHKDDPLLIGYYLVNEPLFEDIPKVVPTYNEKKACKVKLVELLEQKYGAIEKFNQAWNAKLASWEEARKSGLPVITRIASQDLEEFKGVWLEEYFKFVSETARKADPNHMLLGCRLQSGTINNEALNRIGGKYMDVWSYNAYMYDLDDAFLAKVYQWTGGKPMIFSEFHFSSASDSGVHGGAKEVASQQERGLAYRHYVEHAASLPFTLGIEWYTLIDGVVSGFNANCGLLSVADRPWKPMIAEMVKTNYDVYKIATGERPRWIYDNPRFSGKGPTKGTMVADRTPKALTIDGNGGDWPGVPAEQISGNRLVQGGSAGDFAAAVKFCWDADFLYVLADVNDVTPMMNANGEKMLWSGDGIEIFVGSEDMDVGGALTFNDRHLGLGASAEGAKFSWFKAPEPVEVKAAVSPKSGNAGYLLEAAIPWKALAVQGETNKELLFDIAIDDSDDGKIRTRQLMWSGTSKNSTDRSHWGRLRLVGQ